jgi:hypothetical protein
MSFSGLSSTSEYEPKSAIDIELEPPGTAYFEVLLEVGAVLNEFAVLTAEFQATPAPN